MVKTIFAPGRTELAGNHTDHQNGRILASAVEFGLTAKCFANGTGSVNVSSEGYEPFSVTTKNPSVRPLDFGKPISLVRGMIYEFRGLGLSVGGFDASISSTLTAGSGLSSSAAFTVLIGKILSELFNGGSVDPITIARCAQRAENRFFGKPCGLMDQIVSSVGHPVYIDFSTQEIEPITLGFESMGLTLCLTDTGGSHAGLDTSYARIPADMKYIAGLFNKVVLGDVDPKEFYAKGWKAEDRPVRRAMHFFSENERVRQMRDALKSQNGEEYMRLMNESGRSSEMLLNNIVTSATGDTKLEEGLELSAQLLEGKGAWRVHGGGFAGCVQALMPKRFFRYYKKGMEKKFGQNKCIEIKLL